MRIVDMLRQVLDATRFLSRLPVPGGERPGASLAATLRAAPGAGLLIAAGPALLLPAATGAGLPSLATGVLAVTALVVVTGGLHEDGLADVADGFGGGATVGRKLAIMRDSRIGSYGTLALGTTLLLRVAALDGLVARGGAGRAALALIAAAVVSRGLMLVPLALLPAARPDGLGRAAGLDAPALVAPLTVAGVVGTALAAVAVPDRLWIVAGLVASAAAALATTRLADRHIRGVTGDVVGATQQAAEVVFLLALCAAAGAR